MKPKIPIFETVGHGFAFGLRHYFGILRVTWLSAVLAGAVLAAQIAIQILIERGDLKNVTYLLDYFGLFGWIPVYALMAVPAVAAYRMAVFGTEPPRGIVYFRFGGSELQFMAAQLVTTVYMMVYIVLALFIVVPIALGVYYLVGPGEALGATAAAMTGTDDLTVRMRVGSGAVVFFLLLSAFGAVLFSLVQPIVVVERRIGVWKSLRLLWFSNALRLAIVWAIVGVTLLFFTTGAVALLDAFGPAILFNLMRDFDPQNIRDMVIGWTALILVPFVLVATLVLGVTAGVNGYAYRMLILRPKAEAA